jgi:type IV pilus assembly protein PilA
MPNNKGFTWLELLIVLAVIGILAAIAIPNYCDYGGRSQVAKALSEVSLVRVRITTILVEKSRLPSRSEIGLNTLPATKNKALESINWYPKYGTLVVKLTESAAKLTNGGQYLAMAVSLNESKTEAVWNCTTQHPLLADLNVIPEKHLPASCRPKT